MFIVAIIFGIAGVVMLALYGPLKRKASAVAQDERANKSAREEANFSRNLVKWIGVCAGVVTIVALFLASFYTNDEGQAKVLRSFTGEVSGQVTTPGAGFKAPWDDALTYDIRNQQVIYANPDGEQPAGAYGPQITVQDREGVTANIDITVRYSIDPESVSDVYKRYGSQEDFVARFIENDIRAGVRTIPAKFGTLELLNSRSQAESDIRDYLETRWSKQGVRVETVSLQEIRYSKDVKSRFDEAQASRIKIEQARADLEATEVSAQQKIVQAQAEADANAILASSLTAPILQQRYLDTLRELAAAGNLVVVPEGFNGLVNVSK